MRDNDKPPRRKVVLIGDWSVGKTTLICALCGIYFGPSPFAPATQDMRITDIELNGRLIELELWDTAAQEDYDRLRPLSYPGSAVVMLCFGIDSPKSFSNIQERWMPEVLHFFSNPKVPIILVGCKRDLRQKTGASEAMQRGEMITTEKGRELATSINAVEYVECSANENESIRELEKVIGRVAMSWNPAYSGSKREGRKCVVV
ncbi:hypothetical protein M408DRAFT_174511 [Serendipita vermifera MAFF 305830]|uniref:Uncharacterized protein n=1 Tax=Serendipita vermifera MAFF 305830 TaxID=933852 RepID=A0A0C2VZW6_SERVB|nr:hypothetical protein M408DRAFT_174511 [Serendipita vermifera MAFF 305830]